MKAGSKSKIEILVDGVEWEYMHETINKFAFRNKAGEVRLFARWQARQGSKDFKQMQLNKVK